MDEFRSIVRDLKFGRCGVRDYFLSICPLVNEMNVEEVCENVPASGMLEFRKMVAYQKLTGRISEIAGNREPRIVDNQFLYGLECLRKHFRAFGTLQFGDYLLMERETLRVLLQKLEAGGEHVDVKTISEVSGRLKQIELLLEEYEPEVLGKLLMAE